MPIPNERERETVGRVVSLPWFYRHGQATMVRLAVQALLALRGFFYFFCSNNFSVRHRLDAKNFTKIFRFPVTSNFKHMHEALNIDKK
jgi:hypothetical protein